MASMRMARTCLPCRISALLCSLLVLPCAAETAYFQSNGGATSAAGPLPGNLESPGVLSWRVAMDEGHSTPILNNGRIFLTTWKAKAQELASVALEQSTGKLLWRNPIKPEKVEQTHQIGSPATASAACDGKRVYVFF